MDRPDDRTAVTAAMPIVATQDLDCIDRAKFRYRLPTPIPIAFLDAFADAEVTIRPFSRIAPRARDLFSITKHGSFRCDGIVDGVDIVVSFDGDPIDWPVAAIEEFAARLRRTGFPTIDYVRGKDIGCAACPARFAMRCRGAVPSDAVTRATSPVHPPAPA